MTWNPEIGDPVRNASNLAHKVRNTAWQDVVTPSDKVVGAKKYCKFILK
jgi:hypothetical protein